MSWPNVYFTGTISIAVGATTVIGAGTFWSPLANQANLLVVGPYVGFVDAIVDDTHLTIPAWQGPLISGSAYRLAQIPQSSLQATKQLRDFLAATSGLGVIWSVTGTEPDPGLGEDGQYALKTNTGNWKQWLKVAGVWVLQGTPIGVTNRFAWSSVTTYAINDIVTSAGTAYLSNSVNLNKPPTSNPSDWTLLGAKGDKGDTGNQVLNGPGAPSNVLGVNGDFYLATSTNTLYGPKAAGVWPAGVSLVGPQGVAGNTVLYNTGAPTNSLGVDGNFYVATDTHFLYGPKAGGAWPAGTNMVGPSGGSGAAGATGQAGLNGKTIRYNAGPPSGVIGAEEDFYIATDTNTIYGPKSGGVWPAGRALTGPPGPPGAAGQGFTYGASGTLTERVTYDNQPTGFAFLQTDVAPFRLYVKASNTSGDWAGPTPIGASVPVGSMGSVADSVVASFSCGAIA
jgi:hypothetical protein